MHTVVIFCRGVRTEAVYWPILDGWYCARCGSRVGVVTV
jgi:hypothetical protein